MAPEACWPDGGFEVGGAAEAAEAAGFVDVVPDAELSGSVAAAPSGCPR